MNPDVRRLDAHMLLCFEALFVERSVTRAAQRIGLTQQGMSGQLARMRVVFDDPLFIRELGGVTPTPRACSIIPMIRSAMRTLEQIVTVPPFNPENYVGEFTVAASDYATALILPKLLIGLTEKAPAVRLTVRPAEMGTLKEKFRNDNIDLAITVPEFSPPELPSQLLFRERYVGVMRSGHPLSKVNVGIDEFCSYSHLLVAPFRGNAAGPTDIALAMIDRNRKIGLVVPNFSVIGPILEVTDLLAVLPERLIASIRENLIRFETPVPVKGFELGIVWPVRCDTDPAHVWFRGMIEGAATEFSSGTD